MAGPDNTRESATNRQNKAGAMRWAVGAVVVLLVGLIAWWMSDPRGEPIDPTPKDLPGSQQQEQPQQPAANQPPAVAPDADSSSGTLNAPQPATSGAGTQ